ncbi:hypothetical protein SSCG_04519 [Streptomyces clavuligerus]|nr:hypothetical protein SSCG_04519 [Streptomyces clavuligerus]
MRGPDGRSHSGSLLPNARLPCRYGWSAARRTASWSRNSRFGGIVADSEQAPDSPDSFWDSGGRRPWDPGCGRPHTGGGTS